MKRNTERDGLLEHQLNEAVACLREGKIVSFPTESYYGLAVDPYSGSALERLFAAKKREKDKAVLLLIADQEMLTDLVDCVPEVYEKLMSLFWPGPLTLLFPAARGLHPLLTANTGTIGIRLSSDSIATELCARWGNAVTATSANISGRSPAISIAQIQEMFKESVTCFVDAGIRNAPAPSTIVGWTGSQLQLVREGLIPFKDITGALALP